MNRIISYSFLALYYTILCIYLSLNRSLFPIEQKSRIYFSPTFNQQVTSKKEVVFHWDLDDVFFKKNKKKIYAKAAQHAIPTLFRIGTQVLTRLFSSTKDLSYYPELRAFMHRADIKRACRALKGSPADAYKLLLDQYDPRLGNMVLEIANQKQLIPGTVRILKKLSCHTHHVLTNQGTLALRELIKKFPLFFNHFTIITGVDYTPGVPLVNKPNIHYYQAQLAKTDSLHNHVHIFIDDKKENVIAACQADPLYIGIQFDGNPEHLLADLITLKTKFNLNITIDTSS